eukprot:2659964-Pyramimonas_sp.AAC.1
MIDCITTTYEQLKLRQLKIAAMSTIMCTSIQDTSTIVRALRRRGLQIKGVKQAAYLGIDFGCGRLARSTRRIRGNKH